MPSIQKLRQILKERTCIVGMGNYYRKDDAAGLHVVESLRDKIGGRNIIIFNVEDVLESYIFQISEEKPANVLFIDAVEADDEPGSIIFHEIGEEFGDRADFSTHRLSVQLSAKILKQAGIETWVLGIVPADTEYGEGLSDDVEESVKVISKFIINSTNENEKEFLNANGSL